MICPKCGFENPNGGFCGNCGSVLPVEPASIYQPPTPKRKGKKMLMVAIVAVIVVVAVVLAAVMFVLPKGSQSSPSAAIDAYFDGVKSHDAAKMVDSTVMHFDTANRSILLSSLNISSSNMAMTNITIVSTEDISTSDVPADIKLDVTNFTNALQKAYSITIQDSQFEKITIKQTNSSTDSFSSTAYVLFSKVDGKWYFDLYVSYSEAEWEADRSMTDKGWGYFPGYSSTPTATFTAGSNSTGYRYFMISTISSSTPTISYNDCEVRLTVGGHVGSTVDIPSTLHVVMPVNAGTSTGYELSIVDEVTKGYVSVGDFFTVGPFTNTTGLNARQPTGTQVTLTMLYIPTGEVIASSTFMV
jgi:hypothetical protein